MQSNDCSQPVETQPVLVEPSRRLGAANPGLHAASSAVRAAALAALQLESPLEKCAAIEQLVINASLAADNGAGLGADVGADVGAAKLIAPADLPGRPGRPALVSPGRVKKFSLATRQGRAALIHSLVHIEFNAMNLALDVLWRFAGLPADFYADWLGVAREEAQHFCLLNEHLNRQGFQYGDFDAHNGLWEMAARTEGDLLARLALVPRTLEARGLDASPLVRDKLISIGDTAGAAILTIILRDEIGHVRVGNRWYRWACEQQGHDPVAQYAVLAARYQAPILRPPFNFPDRRAAGFTDEELALLGGEVCGA